MSDSGESLYAYEVTMQRYLIPFVLAALLNMELTSALVETVRAGEKPPRRSEERSRTQTGVRQQSESENIPLALAKPTAKGSGVEEKSLSLTLDEARENEENESAMEALFALDTIPSASIPVLENALGDMNHDGFVNIIDVLRLRDIVIGRPPAPTAYELAEGDLNGNNMIDSTDLRMMRDALLFRTGLPHIITPSGGQVVGNAGRTTFSIPALYFSEFKRLRVEDYDQQKFEQDLGMPLAVLGPNVSFMAGANLVVLNPSVGDSSLKPGIEMIERAGSGPTDTTGNNAVFNISSDVQGNGVKQFKLLGDLERDTSRNNMRFRSQTPLQIQGLAEAYLDPRTGIVTSNPYDVLEPGMSVVAHGTGWQSIFPSDYKAIWISGSDTLTMPITYFSTTNPSSKHGIDGVMFGIPLLPTLGQTQLTITCTANGASSNPFSIFLSQPPGLIQPGLKDSLLRVYYKIDTVMTEMVADNLTQEVASIERFDLLNWVSTYRAAVENFRIQPDSLLDPPQMARLFKIVKNSHFSEYYSLLKNNRTGILSPGGPPNPNPECIRLFRVNYLLAESMLGLLDVGGGAFCAVGCCAALPVGCPLCAAACAAGAIGVNRFFSHLLEQHYLAGLQSCCPADYVVACQTFDFDRSDPNHPIAGLDHKLVCIHFKWHAMIAAPYGSWGCVSGCDALRYLGCSGLAPVATTTRAKLSQGNEIRDFTGLQIHVNDSPIPVSQGTVGANGFALIPFNVVSGTVTLSGYEPRTGYFDDNMGQVQVGDPFAEVHVVPLSFNPDTSVIRYSVAIGEFTNGSVAPLSPRHEYRLFIPQSAVGRPLNVAMRAQGQLFFSFKNPSGVELSRDSATSCRTIRHTIQISGTYTLTIARGAFGGQGSFIVAADYNPGFILAGDSLRGRLTTDHSPYLVFCSSTINAGDTLMADPGVTLEFLENGSILANGVLRGIASPANPLVLKPRGQTSQRDMTSSLVPNRRKPTTQEVRK